MTPRFLFGASCFSSRADILNLGRIFNKPFKNLQTRTVMENSASTIEMCKSIAARKAVEENIHSDCILGVGSGSTIRYVLEALVDVCEKRQLSVKCIPTSRDSEQLILNYKLPLAQLNSTRELDLTIDGADEVDAELVAIKGGGACHFKEKLVASLSKKLIVVADYRKNSTHLGDNWKQGVPIEVPQFAWEPIRCKLGHVLDVPIEDIVLRTGTKTDNDNFVLDWRFNQSATKSYHAADWKTIGQKINNITGVIENGIFVDMVQAAYFGNHDGTVTKREK